MYWGSLTVVFCVLGTCFVDADIYMHNPRGSNNRQDESSRNRKNAKRLFDSQNNNRGGHNVGDFPAEMYFYSGSKLLIQWANQHSCKDQNNNCNVVIQYMCDENLRDGETTRRAPVDCDGDCNTNEDYGHHEDLTYYEQCASRFRNKGLFVANRAGKLGDSARHTRQNNKGTRYGFECPEEKDYYPYFGPTPWRDIAIFTNDVPRCNYYKTESQNVKSRWQCTMSDKFWENVRGGLINHEEFEVFLTNDQTSCEQIEIPLSDGNYTGIWKEFPAHDIEAPDCLESLFSRDNHRGNTLGGEFLSYEWTIPDLGVDEATCTIRMRYNISTNDYEYWDTDHTKNFDRKTKNIGPEEIYNSYTFNGELQGRSKEIEAFRRHYYHRDNPQLDVFDLRSRQKNFRTRVALNTAQYGRTFQDRSHAFRIVQRPPELDGVTIHNVNVRGKRGNIVQVYPSVEYDFVPTKLKANKNDRVHFQWTGSDNNPGGNAGQGRARTDRHNVVTLGLRPYPEGDTDSFLTLGTNYPPPACPLADFWGLSHYDVTSLALSGYFPVGEGPGETLDDADAYFDLGPRELTKRGIYHYFSTRNNAFTNRDQKATIEA